MSNTNGCPHSSVCNGGYGRLRCTRCDAIIVCRASGCATPAVVTLPGVTGPKRYCATHNPEARS